MDYNKQNKRPTNLFKKEDWLRKTSDLKWMETSLFMNNDKMNRKVAKLSPRRHKRESRKLLDQLFNNEQPVIDFGELTEMLDQLEE